LLVPLEGPDAGRGHPVEAHFSLDGGPFGAPNLLALLPVQGAPLRPDTLYAAAVRRDLGDAGGAPLGASATLRGLAAGRTPAGMSPEVAVLHHQALDTLQAHGAAPDDLAGLTVFRSGDPTDALIRARDQVLAETQPDLPAFEHIETYEDLCVFRSEVVMPVFQEGEPPYAEVGGAWVWREGRLVQQGTARARVFLTLPRRAAPAAGFPTVVFVRTGGGGDRPLVDRGVRGVPGGPALEPGSGPARGFARAGWAGLSVDGPLGGLRNPSGADEQFLIFNILNPAALRDNLRQSALEVILTAHLVEQLSVTATTCPGLVGPAKVDAGHLALMGHSMGATLAPLAFALEPRFEALLLSGAGGSWIENVIHKESPLTVRPLAELTLGYPELGRTLDPFDPALNLLQWAGEPADPPVYAGLDPAPRRHVLMFQGIVDTYILPPIANPASNSLGLDLAGAALEPSITPRLALFGLSQVDLPVAGNDDGRTRVVVQHPQDPVEDGHEVVFQTEGPKHQYRCFLEDLAAGRVPQVPVAGDEEQAPCR
jgi:hypothetical protein